MASEEIRIRPSDWHNAPESEDYVLSHMDHLLPKIYCLIVEAFELPEGTDKNAIVLSLKKGLEVSLAQFPILAGALYMDPSNGGLLVNRKRDSSVALTVKTMEGDGDFPSFEYLDQHDFPVQLLPGHKLLPPPVTEKQPCSPLGDNGDENTDVSTFQITFIKGGVIIAAAIHHTVSDGPGCSTFLTSWAANSAAARKGTTFQPVTKDTGEDRNRLNCSKIDPEKWKQLKINSLKDTGGPPPPLPADFKMPTLKPRMWHFSKSNAAKLKSDSTPAQGGGWVSTYDAIMGLAWKAITKAKLPLLKPGDGAESVLIHAVNTRTKLSPPLPESFIGNAVALPKTEPMLIADFVEQGPLQLSRAAVASRESINTITQTYMASLLEWVAGLEDRRWIMFNMHSFMGLDLLGTSWQSMTPYINHDFGFGLPKAMRWPLPLLEGAVFVLPSRANVKPESSDEGVEIIVCLEESCQDRLLEDKEMLKYAEPRGAYV